MKFVYQGKVIAVEEKLIDNINFELVHMKGGIVVFPVTSEKKIILIKEIRPHETPSIRIKPITGFFEENLTWQENANKEMQEEIGMKAANLELFFDYQSKGTVNVQKHYVLAKELISARIPNPDGDVVLDIIEVTIDELLEKTLGGEIPISVDTLGIFLLYHKVKRGEIAL